MTPIPGPPASASPPPGQELILPLCAIFRRFLKRQGLKFTTERATILDAVLARDGVFEAEELLDDVRTGDRRASKATIYRTLKHLVEAGIVTEVLIDARQTHYQLSFGREPKGYLVCVETNEIIEFPAHELVALRDRICKEHGFEPLSHQFVVYGVRSKK
ncbi:MAG: transcriptional repressor [Phycisphaeraceae bacterium]